MMINKIEPLGLTMEELEEFRYLAEQTDKIPKEELAKTAPLLTTRTYLEMCRVAYDAASDWEDPEDTSTEELFCKARSWSTQHEYDHGILGCDWDSPEEFAQRFNLSYHNDEIFFGGPTLYISDESAKIGEHVYTRPEIYGQWTGSMGCKPYFTPRICKAVRIYIALRKKGYPVYFYKYKEILDAVEKHRSEKL